jgi:hypothetical protein
VVDPEAALAKVDPAALADLLQAARAAALVVPVVPVVPEDLAAPEDRVGRCERK